MQPDPQMTLVDQINLDSSVSTGLGTVAGVTSATDLLVPKRVVEFGGPSGPEPTRYGDWEKNGRCIDF